MTPENTHAAVVSMLQQQGLPLTTANLNRGMLALAQNDMQTENVTLPAVNRSIDRTTGAAQQAASPSPLPTPPIPPTTVPQQQAATTLELSTPGTLPAGVRNSIEAFLADKGTQPAMPDGSASSTAAASVAAPTTPPPFTYDTMMEDIRAGRVPNPNPDLPLILFGTGPVPRAGGAYPAMQQYLRQRTMDIMRQNPQRPPSNMLNQAGDGYEEALAARARAGQRPAYKGEGVDDFIQGGNNTQPTPSVKQNTAPTWKGEGDPSAPMGTRSIPSGTQSLPKQTSNTAAPHTPAQDTSGAGAAIKQTLTKRKQMAASKSTRKSED